MKKQIILISILSIVIMLAACSGGSISFIPGDSTASGVWVYVGNQGISTYNDCNNITLRFNGNTPYVAFKNNYASPEIWVFSWDGNSWYKVFAAAAVGIGSNPAMEINSSGEIFVAYKSFSSSKISVRNKDGATWQDLGPQDFSDGAVGAIDLTLVNATLYATFPDYSTNGRASIWYYHNSTSSWSNLTTSPMPVEHFDTFSYQNMYTVAFKDVSNAQAISVYQFPGPMTSPNDLGGGNTFFTRPVDADYVAACTSGNDIYVAYTSGSLLYVAAYNGSSWRELGTTASDGSAQYPSIAVYNGTVYIAYKDKESGGDRLTVKYWDSSSSSWITMGKRSFTDGASDYSSIAVNSSGEVHVAFHDGSKGGNVSVMKFDPNATSTGTGGSTGVELEWVSGYPIATGGTGEIALTVSLQETACTAYYVILTSGSTTPTPQEIKDGTATGQIRGGSISCPAQNATYGTTESSISAGTYDVYFISEDSGSSLSSDARRIHHSVTVNL